MTTSRANKVLILAIVLLIVAAFLSCSVVSLMPQVQGAADVPQRPLLRSLTAVEGYDPIATYDPGERVLTVTDHIGADVLICIGGKCGLPSSWEHLAPAHWKEGGQ